MSTKECMTLEVYRTGGKPGQFRRPYGIALDADNNVWVADNTNHRIQEFTSTGTFLRQMGSNGSLPGQFFQLRRVAITPGESTPDVYGADLWGNKIERFHFSNGAYSYAQTYGGVPATDRLQQSVRFEAGEYGDGGLRSDSADADQAGKQIFLPPGSESEQCEALFADMGVDLQINARTDLADVVIRGERHDDVVSDAPHVHDDPAGIFFEQRPREPRDHAITCTESRRPAVHPQSPHASARRPAAGDRSRGTHSRPPALPRFGRC
jgi:hypothetical protein